MPSPSERPTTPARRPARGRGEPRPVAEGDVVDRVDDQRAQRDRTQRGTSEALTELESATSDILALATLNGASDAALRIRALLDGASPDERKALRRALFDKPAKNPHGTCQRD